MIELGTLFFFFERMKESVEAVVSPAPAACT